jgi:hypothetical protein
MQIEQKMGDIIHSEAILCLIFASETKNKGLDAYLSNCSIAILCMRRLAHLCAA